MKIATLVVLSLMLAAPAEARRRGSSPRAYKPKAYKSSSPVRVKGYIKKDGTYVAPSHRKSPNSTKFDNYSTQGNVNPYTGKEGTVDPLKPAAPTKP